MVSTERVKVHDIEQCHVVYYYRELGRRPENSLIFGTSQCISATETVFHAFLMFSFSVLVRSSRAGLQSDRGNDFSKLNFPYFFSNKVVSM